MKPSTALAVGAAWSLALLATPAIAESRPGHTLYRPHGSLPPIAGTLRMHPNAFGRGHGTAVPSLARGNRSPSDRPELSARSRFERGDQGRAWQQFGTPATGMSGSGAGAYAAMGTGWGTADSATGGGAYPVPSSRTGSARFGGYRAEVPVNVVYGEPDVWSGGYGVAPTGGLGYYGSGSRGRMAYYSSSSSAGYGGTPGGLAIYSSGAYGPGATIIHVGRRAAWPVAYGYGPHIIHVGHHHRHVARW